MAKRCPHKEIRFCPLYIASHGLQHADGKWLGCIDGKETGADRDCGVRRGVNYQRMLARIEATDPAMVARAAFQEEAAHEWQAAEARRAARRRMLN